jgi:hypothetical protein
LHGAEPWLRQLTRQQSTREVHVDPPRVVSFPGTEHLELPGRMQPIILAALDFVRSLGFDPDLD